MQFEQRSYAQGYRHGIEDGRAEIRRLRAAVVTLGGLTDVDADYRDMIVRQVLAQALLDDTRCPPSAEDESPALRTLAAA